MHTHPWLSLLLLAVGLAAGCAAEVTIPLNEYLNRRWTHELVSYPFSAPEGACLPASLTLTGPHGAQAAQLTDVAYWPDGKSVKTARLAFVVDELPPLAQQVYTVRYGAAPAPATAGDLRVTRTPDRLEAVTSRFSARLLLGEKTYDPPAAAATVPGPVQGMRLADGTWFGGSRLFGDMPLASYTARVLEAGPVLVRVAVQYRYAGGAARMVTLQLAAGSDHLTVTNEAPKPDVQNGWELRFTGLPPLALQFRPQQVNLQPGARQLKNGWKERPISDYTRGGLVARLEAWGNWVNEFEQTTIYLALMDNREVVDTADPEVKTTPSKKDPPDSRELVIKRLDPGAWVTPNSHENRQNCFLPLVKDDDDALTLRVNDAVRLRRWSVGERPTCTQRSTRPCRMIPNVQPDEVASLDDVKDMVLSWPDGIKHPNLFLDAEELKAAGVRNPGALRQLQDIANLRDGLGALGEIDTMRYTAALICLYDALIDSPLVSAQERPVLRAQMAYLAYRITSPANWANDRGYNSGNPNMTVAHVLNQGLLACALADHPLAKTWTGKPLAMMDGWMNGLDTAGHWPESSGYARVSVSKMIFYAIAAQRAGLAPLLTDARFKRMALYYERTLTPPDPMRFMNTSTPEKPLHPRVTPPYGRGGNGNAMGLGGMVAKATATLDPAYSRVLQWSFAGSQYSPMLGEAMYGYDQLLTDPTLPTQAPDWRSELLPSVGPFFRSGVGTPAENYLLFVTKNPTNPDGEIWPSEVGALTVWFEHGVPLTREFPAGHEYAYLHGLLLNRVMLATNYAPGTDALGGYLTKETMTGFATLPRADYVSEAYQWTGMWNFFTAPPKTIPAFPKMAKAGALPAGWQRQALYVRDAAADGTNYLVLRDTVTGNQPTQWQFWTLSKRLDVPGATAEAADDDGQPEALNPGAVELKGDRLTAIGQFGLDLDYYIASPTDTPRFTLRAGEAAPVTGVVRGFAFDQDLLHLRLPGDGSYYVALVPRPHDAPAPAFATLAGGAIIKVTGAFGTDYVCLQAQDGPAAAEGVAVTGTAACVQVRPTGTVLALAAPGSITWQKYGISAPFPASVTLADKVLRVEMAPGHPEGVITLTAPAGWTLKAGATATLDTSAPYRLHVKAGVEEVVLTRK
jgi:hypothetical protein